MDEKRKMFRRLGMIRNADDCRRFRDALYNKASEHIANYLTDSVVGEREERLHPVQNLTMKHGVWPMSPAALLMPRIRGEGDTSRTGSDHWQNCDLDQ
jgi:hypothetical protein